MFQKKPPMPMAPKKKGAKPVAKPAAKAQPKAQWQGVADQMMGRC